MSVSKDRKEEAVVLTQEEQQLSHTEIAKPKCVFVCYNSSLHLFFLH